MFVITIYPSTLLHQLEYQVDLDSVYEVAGSNRPVYKLAKVHTQERNQFELLVQVVYADNQVSEHIASKPFLIKTKRMKEEPAGILVDNKFLLSFLFLQILLICDWN